MENELFEVEATIRKMMTIDEINDLKSKFSNIDMTIKRSTPRFEVYINGTNVTSFVNVSWK